MPNSKKSSLNKLNQSGFGLIELLVAATIIAIAYSVVSFQITKEPIFKARDDVRKTDINSIANAYIAKAIDKNVYEPLTTEDYLTSKIPTPPEGEQYQGLLTEPQEYFFICAQLEKGKDINCLVNSDNPNCYCRKSHTGDGPIPTPTSAPSPISSPTPSISPPNPTSSPTPTAYPRPACIPSDAVDDFNFYQGTDGTWCYNSDGRPGGWPMDTGQVKGYCMDSCSGSTISDSCSSSTKVVESNCYGWKSSNGWTNLRCEAISAFASTCPSGLSCSDGACASSLPPKRVFITSQSFAADNFGSLSGADNICQAAANSAGLGGIWKAWLSDDNTAARDRLNHHNGYYKRLDGAIVANSWDGLTSGYKVNRISVNEFGGDQLTSGPVYIWTGTGTGGYNYNFPLTKFPNCSNWTTKNKNSYGEVGNAAEVGPRWTQYGSASQPSEVASCDHINHLYCFEQ